MSISGWSTQQLAEFVAAVSAAPSETSAATVAAERVAEALDADVAAIVCGGELLAAIGYPAGTAPVGELERVKPGLDRSSLTVPGVGACAAAAAPLEHPAGATLVIARPAPHALTREEIALLRGMARVASMTMRMLRVLDDERGAREEIERLAGDQAALRRVAMLIARGVAPDLVFGAVAEEVGSVLHAAAHAFVGRYEDGPTMDIVGAWSRAGDAGLVGSRMNLGGHNVGTLVFERERPERVDRFPEDDESAITAIARAIGSRSSAGAPISVEGRLWGVMIVGSAREDTLPAGTEYRLAQFTELVATAIANAQAREELRRVADEQAALRRVATLVARAAPAPELFAAVAQEVGQLFASESTLWRYDPDGTVTVLGAWSGAGSSRLTGERFPIRGHNAVTLVFESGRPSRVDRYPEEDSSPLTTLARGLGGRTAVGAPITVAGRLWGAAIVMLSRHEDLPADTEERLADFGELVASAIANAEAQAELTASRARIVASADNTRRKIERDIHDGAQQRLVSLALRLRAAQALVPPGLHELAAELSDLAAGVSGALDELRELALGVHPPILAQAGLGPALRMIARRSSVPVELDVRAQGRLPSPVEVAAYYAVSEAVTNAAKHARATTVSVEVEVDASDRVLRVLVRDDGVGGADFARGSGLGGLRDRVEALGGRIVLQSNRGLGTSVLVELPLAVDAPALTSR